MDALQQDFIDTAFDNTLFASFDLAPVFRIS